MEIVEVLNLNDNSVGTLTGQGFKINSFPYYKFKILTLNNYNTYLNKEHFFSDGKDLKIAEFTNSRYSCGIALEDKNSLIVTGGLVNST